MFWLSFLLPNGDDYWINGDDLFPEWFYMIIILELLLLLSLLFGICFIESEDLTFLLNVNVLALSYYLELLSLMVLWHLINWLIFFFDVLYSKYKRKCFNGHEMRLQLFIVCCMVLLNCLYIFKDWSVYTLALKFILS